MKLKIKKLLKKILFLLIYSLIFFGIGCVVAIAISNRFNYKLQDVMSYEGLILILIGILFSMKGSPSGTNFNGIGLSNENAISFQNLEVTRQERESNTYYKDFFKNNVVELAFSNLTFILSGIIMVAFVMIIL